MSPVPQFALYVWTFIWSKSLANKQRHDSPRPARAIPPPAKNSRYVRSSMFATHSYDQIKLHVASTNRACLPRLWTRLTLLATPRVVGGYNCSLSVLTASQHPVGK